MRVADIDRAKVRFSSLVRQKNTHVKGIQFISGSRLMVGRRTDIPSFKVYNIENPEEYCIVRIPKYGWDQAWKRALSSHGYLNKKFRANRRFIRAPKMDRFVEISVIYILP